MAELFIGTSGWNYRHWVGVLYPEGAKSDRWLGVYSEQLKTVELNVTFYRTPRTSTVEKWISSTPEDFVFSVKMNRFITHIKRLADVAQSVADFEAFLSHFGSKLGVTLIQLPPSLKYDAKFEDSFFRLLRGRDKALRYAIEPRNKTWFDEEVYEVLGRYRIALCQADSGGRYPTGEAILAPFTYLRFHGPGGLYGSSYKDPQLKETTQKIRQHLDQGLDVYVYFNNDVHGYAVENARRLLELTA